MIMQMTVTEHLLFKQSKSEAATGQFTRLLYDLILAAKNIWRNVDSAGLANILGGTGNINVQGERVQKLDELANNTIIYCMERSGTLCGMASEENAEIITLPPKFPKGEYFLYFDPLDGSSNIDANINVGTIFSLFRRNNGQTSDPDGEEFLKAGLEQVAAGYFLYGPSCMMVYSTGQGVHGFTLDPTVGEFMLSHPDILIPDYGRYYSVNESNWLYWDEATREAVSYFKGMENPLGKPYSLRYVGSLVADFHRTLLYGGIFMYPIDYKQKDKPKGKLRLLYEASPLSFLIEQAGGKSIDGARRIMEIVPEHLHQRVPLIIGSPKDVEAVESIYKKHRIAG